MFKHSGKYTPDGCAIYERDPLGAGVPPMVTVQAHNRAMAYVDDMRAALEYACQNLADNIWTDKVLKRAAPFIADPKRRYFYAPDPIEYTTVEDEQEIAKQSSTPVSVMSILESVRIEWPEYRSWDDNALWSKIQDAFRRDESNA